MSEKISVTRGLAELKVLTSRIKKTIAESMVHSLRKGAASPVGFKSVEEFETKAKASNNKITDLKRRYRDIKSKIILSNAEVKVTIADEEMSVAEAIEYKSSIMFDKDYLRKLRRLAGENLVRLERKDREVESRLDVLIEANFGKEGKVDKEAYKNIAEPFMKQNQWTALDPINIQDTADKLADKIDAFELEVDFALSESNAKTEITIG